MDGPPLHMHKVVSFAADRAGVLLATGSVGGDDAESPVVGLVLWEIHSGRPLHSVAVAGGVGLQDQLHHGVRFSASGKRLGYNYFTNAVGVLDVTSGKVVLEAHASIDDGPPAFGLSDDDVSIFVAQTSALDCHDALGTIASLPSGKLACFASADAKGPFHVSAFRRGVIHGIDREKVRSIDAHSRKLVRERPLPTAVGSGHFLTDTSPSGHWLGVASDGGGASLLDLDTGAVTLVDPKLTYASGFAFDAAEHRWAVVRAQEQRAQGVALFDGSRTLGAIPGPLQMADWLNFADGLPFAFSPDGKSALLLRPGGTLERWRVDGPVREAVLAPRLDGARGVLWPAADRAVVIGPRLLVFLEMGGGAIIAQHHFPE